MHNDKRSTPPSGSVDNSALVLLRGGGDLATGVALRLHQVGIKLVITELARPLAVRRAVSFAEAVYEGQHAVEGVMSRLVKREQPRPEFYRRVSAALEADEIPVLVDPDADILTHLFNYQFLVVIDARLLKAAPSPLPVNVPLHIGLGPGFQAGINCDAASEHIEAGQVVASIQVDVATAPQRRKDASTQVHSPFAGVLRGLIRDGIHVTKGLKIGDIDPRDDPSACFLVSDKALAIGGAVLEAILTRQEIREKLWK